MAQKRQDIREALSGLHYGPTCMVYSIRCQSWYCAHIVCVDGDVLKVQYRGWKEDEEEVHKLSDRLDCSTGGRKKWKAIKGATGAFRRVWPEWIPTGAQLEPAVLLSLAPASARKERKDSTASGQKQHTRHSQLQRSGAGTSQTLQSGPGDSSLPAGDLPDSSDDPGADADDVYGGGDAADGGVSGSRGELHPAKRRRILGMEAPHGRRTASCGSHDGLRQIRVRDRRGQSEGPPDKVGQGMDETGSALRPDHRTEFRLALSNPDTRHRQRHRRERRPYAATDWLIPCQHDDDHMNERTTRNHDANDEEAEDNDKSIDYEHQDDDMEEDERGSEDGRDVREIKEEDNAGFVTRLGGPAMDDVYRSRQRRAVKRRNSKIQNFGGRRHTLLEDEDSSSSSGSGSYNSINSGSDDGHGSRSCNPESDTARYPAADETELERSGHMRGRRRRAAGSRGRGRGRGHSEDLTNKPESEPTPKLDRESLVSSPDHSQPILRRGRGRPGKNGRGRGSGPRSAMPSVTRLRVSESPGTYKLVPAGDSDVHDSGSRQPGLGKGRRRQPSSLGFEQSSPNSAMLQLCGQQQLEQQQFAGGPERGSRSREGRQEGAGPSQNPASIQPAGCSRFASVKQGREDADGGRGDANCGDASNSANPAHREKPADEELQPKDPPSAGSSGKIEGTGGLASLELPAPTLPSAHEYLGISLAQPNSKPESDGNADDSQPGGSSGGGAGVAMPPLCEPPVRGLEVLGAVTSSSDAFLLHPEGPAPVLNLLSGVALAIMKDNGGAGCTRGENLVGRGTCPSGPSSRTVMAAHGPEETGASAIQTNPDVGPGDVAASSQIQMPATAPRSTDMEITFAETVSGREAGPVAAAVGALNDPGAAAEIGVATVEETSAEEAVTEMGRAATEGGPMEAQTPEADGIQLAGTSELGLLPLAQRPGGDGPESICHLASSDEFELQGWPLILWAAIDPVGTTSLQDLPYRSPKEEHSLVPLAVVGAAAVRKAAAIAAMAAARAAGQSPGSAHTAHDHDGRSPAWEATERAQGLEGQTATPSENYNSVKMEEAQDEDSLLCMMPPPLSAAMPLHRDLTSEGSLLDVMLTSQAEVLAQQQEPEGPLTGNVPGLMGRSSQISELHAPPPIRDVGGLCPGTWSGDPPPNAMVETEAAAALAAPPAQESMVTATEVAGIVPMHMAPAGCDDADAVAMVSCATMVGEVAMDAEVASECLTPGLEPEEAAHLNDCICPHDAENASAAGEKRLAMEASVEASDRMLSATLSSETNFVERVSDVSMDEGAPALGEAERVSGQGCQAVAAHLLVAATAAMALAEAEVEAPAAGEREAEVEWGPRQGMTDRSSFSLPKTAKAVTDSQSKEAIPNAADQGNATEHGPDLQETLDNLSLPEDGNATQTLVVSNQSAEETRVDMPVAAATNDVMGRASSMANSRATHACPDVELPLIVEGASQQQTSGRLARLAVVVREAATGLGARGSVLAAAAAEALGLRNAHAPAYAPPVLMQTEAAAAVTRPSLLAREGRGSALRNTASSHPCHSPSSLDPGQGTRRGLLQLPAEPLEPSQPQQRIQAQLPMWSSPEEGLGHGLQAELLGSVPGAATWTGTGTASPQGPLTMTTRQMHGDRRKSSRPQRQRPLEYVAMGPGGIPAAVSRLNGDPLLRSAEAMGADRPQQISAGLHQPCALQHGQEENEVSNEETRAPQQIQPGIAGHATGGHSSDCVQHDQRQLSQLAEETQLEQQPLQQLQQQADLEPGSNRSGDGAASGVDCAAADLGDAYGIMGGALRGFDTSRSRPALSKGATAGSPRTVPARSKDLPDLSRSEGAAQPTQAPMQAELRVASTGRALVSGDKDAAGHASADTVGAAARDENTDELEGDDDGGRRTAVAQEVDDGDGDATETAPKTARRFSKRVAERAGAHELLLTAEVHKLRGMLEGQQRRVRNLERELQAEKRLHAQSQEKCKALEEANQQQRRRQSAAADDTSSQVIAERLLCYANRLQGHCLNASETAGNIIARLEALPQISSLSKIPAAASGGNPAASGTATLQRTRNNATTADVLAWRLEQLEQLCGRLQGTSQDMHNSLLQIQRAEPDLWERLLPHLPKNMREASIPTQPLSRVKTLVEEFNALTGREGAVSTLSEQLDSLATLVEQRSALLTVPFEAAILAVMPHADRERTTVLRLLRQLPVMLPEEAILVLPKDKVPREVLDVAVPLSLPEPVRRCQGIVKNPQQGLRQVAPAHMQHRAMREMEHNPQADGQQQQHEMQRQQEMQQQQMQRRLQQQNARPQVPAAQQHCQQRLEPRDQQQGILQSPPPAPRQQQQKQQQQLQPQGPRAPQPQQTQQEPQQVQTHRAVSERPALPQHPPPPQTRYQEQQQEPFQPHVQTQLRRPQQQYLQQQQWQRKMMPEKRDEERQQQAQQPRPVVSADMNLTENLLTALCMSRPSVANETALVAGGTALRRRSRDADIPRGQSALAAQHDFGDEPGVSARAAKRPRAISGVGSGLQVQTTPGNSPECQPLPLKWRQQPTLMQRLPPSALQDLQSAKASASGGVGGGGGGRGVSATIVEQSTLQPRRHYNEPLQHPSPASQQQHQPGLHRASRTISPGRQGLPIKQYVHKQSASQSPSQPMIMKPLPIQFQVEASDAARLVELGLGSGQRLGSGSQKGVRAAQPASQSVPLVVASVPDIGHPSALIRAVPSPAGLVGHNQSRPKAAKEDGVAAARAAGPSGEQSLPQQQPTLVYTRGRAGAAADAAGASAQDISRRTEPRLQRAGGGGGGVHVFGGVGSCGAGEVRGVDAGGNQLTAQLLQQLAAEAARGGNSSRKPRVVLMPSEQLPQGHLRGQVGGRFANLDLQAQPASALGQHPTPRLAGAPLRPIYDT